ncbi:phosphoesterase, putative [Babesia ovata]|uniref:Phosphoesterase, putative n=1 Tax=Babesia ovata TaxID=189622 RepID=A0A2H6K9M2_9APIC|nr:phosphoesterase, putative [Babesia ovata]GBE59702.1 phosphoesterase, putative [Babesia ovata]
MLNGLAELAKFCIRLRDSEECLQLLGPLRACFNLGFGGQSPSDHESTRLVQAVKRDDIEQPKRPIDEEAEHAGDSSEAEEIV